MQAGTISEFLRIHRSSIATAWRSAVVGDVKELTRMGPDAVLDKLPEMIDALADWVNGDESEADSALVALADGHAFQRLGFGIELATVTTEYATLRRVICERLSAQASPRPRTEELTRLNAGIDRAIHLSVRHYMRHRDYVRDRFIGVLGHDLRNPLSAVIMTGQALMQSETLSGDDLSDAQLIVDAADRMQRMIQDILDFARRQLAAGIPATPSRCDMAEICQAAVDEVKNAHPERSIDIRCSGNMQGAFDRDRVFQALVNLLTNAIQHGEDPVHFVGSEAVDGRAILTRVSNAGAAIPAHMATKLFSSILPVEFAREGHLGLGLYVVQQIARAHGATYDVTSSDEETAFTIRWPRSL